MYSTTETLVRVLCVDDEPNLLDSTKSILELQSSFKVETASSVDEAFLLTSRSDQIELVNECEELSVQADSLLRQVFYNLIENSGKHGEKVTQIKVNYKEGKNALKIIYTDNGIGILKNESQDISRKLRQRVRVWSLSNKKNL